MKQIQKPRSSSTHEKRQRRSRNAAHGTHGQQGIAPPFCNTTLRLEAFRSRPTRTAASQGLPGWRKRGHRVNERPRWAGRHGGFTGSQRCRSGDERDIHEDSVRSFFGGSRHHRGPESPKEIGGIAAHRRRYDSFSFIHIGRWVDAGRIPHSGASVRLADGSLRGGVAQLVEQRTHKPHLVSLLHAHNATFINRIAAPSALPRFSISDRFPPKPTSSGVLVNIW